MGKYRSGKLKKLWTTEKSPSNSLTSFTFIDWCTRSSSANLHPLYHVLLTQFGIQVLVHFTMKISIIPFLWCTEHCRVFSWGTVPRGGTHQLPSPLFDQSLFPQLSFVPEIFQKFYLIFLSILTTFLLKTASESSISCLKHQNLLL